MEVTMAMDADAALLRSLGERFKDAHGDPSLLGPLLHEDIVWVLPGQNAVSGEVRGIDGILGRLERLAGFGLDINVEAVAVGRAAGALLLHNTGAKDGRAIDVRVVSTFTVRDEKIDYIDSYVSDIDMMNRFFVA
jgi:ketosteroid isomerase-like protein